MSSSIILLTPSTPDATTILTGIAHLHAHCILHDHTLATFLPPLSPSRMLMWWNTQLTQVTSGTRDIIVHLSPTTSRNPMSSSISPPFPDSPYPTFPDPSSSSSEEFEVSAVVTLSKPITETGPFRADVQKLFVSPWHRKKGIARAVMEKLEEAAWEEGRWSLMLDAIVGTKAAEVVYPRLGYKRVGVVEEYGISPEDGRLVDVVWFCKDLRKDRRL